MPTVISFKTTFDLSLSPKQFIFEDTSDYTGQGVDPTDQNGCIEITTPSGIPYYTNGDFSNSGCDIEMSVSALNKIVIPLPQVLGVVEPGTYIIKYSSYNVTTAETSVITNTYAYTYVPKKINITQDANCLSPRFTSTDITDYGIIGATLTLTRIHTVDFPYGSPGETAPIVGPLATYSTAQFWNGTQTTEIQSTVEYLFTVDGLNVKDYLVGNKELLVDCEDTCRIMCCIKAASNRLKEYRTSNRSEYNLLLPTFNLAVSYLTLLIRSQECGMAEDMDWYMTEIKRLLNCTDDCCTEGTVPTQVIGLGNVNIVVVESGAYPVIVDVDVTGDTTTYTITLDQDFMDRVNALWSSIVVAGQNVTSVGVVTNPDGSKTYTINAKKAVVVAGPGITVTPSAEVAGVITYTVTNNIVAGDNIALSGTAPIAINGKKAIVVAGAGITVTPSSEIAGVITYTVTATAVSQPNSFDTIHLPGTTTRYFFLGSGTSFGEVTYFKWPGTATMPTPTKVSIIASSSAAVTDAGVTLSDDTHSLNWINNEAVSIGTAISIIDLGVPTNISSSPAIMRLQLTAGTDGDLTAYTLCIEY